MIRRALALFSLLSLLTVSAWAYVPPSFFMLKTLASKHAGHKSLRVRSTVSATEASGKVTAHFKEILLVDFASHTVRSRAFDDTGKLLFGSENRFATEGEKAMPIASLLLLETNAEHLAKRLKALGVPVRTEAELLELKDEQERRGAESLALGRVRGHVGWIIGAPTPKNKTRPQLWIEKDRFVPLRLFAEVAEKGVDIRFLETRFHREFPFPRLIELAFQEKDVSEAPMVLKAEANEVSRNADLGELKQKLEPGYTDAGQSADSAVRELIDRYYSFIR